MAHKINHVVKVFRDNGVQVIHSPSDTMGFYKEHSARQSVAVLDILEKPLESLKPVKLASWTKQVELHFQQIPTLEEVKPQVEDNELTAGWKRQMLADPARLRPNTPLHMQLVQIAEKLAFLAIDGEVVVEYGLWAKSLSGGKVLPLGYSNGMLGYIPTAQQILEGGYESKGSTMAFGYPSYFSLGVEPVIRQGIEELIHQMNIANE